jgi:hypothetical protein
MQDQVFVSQPPSISTSRLFVNYQSGHGKHAESSGCHQAAVSGSYFTVSLGSDSQTRI